ncbi:MAG: AraC family transcriptional regulator [Ruminococcaceae bacterium]|nr:AraC family transcriptional regulator [Oscillospiraceae bacterium]
MAVYNMLNAFNDITLSVSQMRYVKLDSRWHSDFARVTFSRIYYVCKGEADVVCNGTPHHLTPGNIYFVPAGSDFSYSCEEYMEKLYIHVSVLQKNRYDLFSRLKECVVLPGLSREEFRRLCRCVGSADANDMMYLKAHLHDLLMRVVDKSGVDLGRPEVYAPLTERALEYMEEHLSCGLTVKQVAQALRVSADRLQRTFQQDVKLSVGRYITKRVLYAAEERLRISDDSIQDISEHFGFCDQFYFSRRFADYFGVSPRRYRKFISIGQPIELD